MTKENKEYISLKEAAEITGYSADYVGQLIRSGKLEGKQVFLNVAWMTTREALQKYAQKDKRGKDSQAHASPSGVQRFLSPEGLTKMFTILSGLVVGLLSIVLCVFAYIFAVSVDHRINASYLEKIEYVR